MFTDPPDIHKKQQLTSTNHQASHNVYRTPRTITVHILNHWDRKPENKYVLEPKENY